MSSRILFWRRCIAAADPGRLGCAYTHVSAWRNHRPLGGRAPGLLRPATRTPTPSREETPCPTAVLRSTQGRIGILTVNNPPVNALAAAVRDGIKSGVEAFGADPNIDAIVLIGGGRTFIAGADIREFGKPPSGANLNDVIATMENCPKIVVAALHGTPLGGGLETALGAHYRVALPSHARRPARGASRPAAGRRRHAAPAAPDRRQVRARRHPLGPPHPRARGQEQGHRRCASSRATTCWPAPWRMPRCWSRRTRRAAAMRDLSGDARIARPVQGDREGDRPPRARLQGAVEHHQVRAGRRRAAVRRGHEARARAVRRAADLAGVGGAALLLLRRARGRQGARRAGRHAAARRSRRPASSAPARWAAASP